MRMIQILHQSLIFHTQLLNNIRFLMIVVRKKKPGPDRYPSSLLPESVPTRLPDRRHRNGRALHKKDILS
ncbi:hypothetical protein [Dubosiella newyorkensis]|uniref:hypothetical protein n=1 Tax=Dubosiella newyorkensis TaxID=1862672 RepID=UPI003514414C